MGNSIIGKENEDTTKIKSEKAESVATTGNAVTQAQTDGQSKMESWDFTERSTFNIYKQQADTKDFTQNGNLQIFLLSPRSV